MEEFDKKYYKIKDVAEILCPGKHAPLLGVGIPRDFPAQERHQQTILLSR